MFEGNVREIEVKCPPFSEVAIFRGGWGFFTREMFVEMLGDCSEWVSVCPSRIISLDVSRLRSGPPWLTHTHTHTDSFRPAVLLAQPAELHTTEDCSGPVEVRGRDSIVVVFLFPLHAQLNMAT